MSRYPIFFRACAMPTWREVSSSSSQDDEDSVPSKQTCFISLGFATFQELTQEQLDYLECGKHFVDHAGFFSGIRFLKITLEVSPAPLFGSLFHLRIEREVLRSLVRLQTEVLLCFRLQLVELLCFDYISLAELAAMPRNTVGVTLR